MTVSFILLSHPFENKNFDIYFLILSKTTPVMREYNDERQFNGKMN